MNKRDFLLLQMRIPSNLESDQEPYSEERFQNQILRPVIRIQENLLIALFKQYIHRHKHSFFQLSVQRRLEYIDRSLQKDLVLRNRFQGIIIGQFTGEEFEFYSTHSTSQNKRMMYLITEHLKENLQLFEMV